VGFVTLLFVWDRVGGGVWVFVCGGLLVVWCCCLGFVNLVRIVDEIWGEYGMGWGFGSGGLGGRVWVVVVVGWVVGVGL